MPFHHARWPALLLAGALALPGCGGDRAGESAAPTNGAALAEDDTVCGTTEPPEGWTIPVVDAAGFDALRRQTAAEGKVLVVDVWATWCTSCVAMFPKLHAAMKDRGERVVAVSLCFDAGEEFVDKARAFLIKQQAWPTGYIADPEAKDAIAASISDAWSPGVLPAVFVFNTDGTLAHEMLETRGTVNDWVAEIGEAADAALAAAPAQTSARQGQQP